MDSFEIERNSGIGEVGLWYSYWDRPLGFLSLVLEKMYVRLNTSYFGYIVIKIKPMFLKQFFSYFSTFHMLR